MESKFISNEAKFIKTMKSMKCSFCFQKWDSIELKATYEAIYEDKEVIPIFVHDNYILVTSGDRELRKVIRKYSTRQFTNRTDDKIVTFYAILLPQDKELAEEVKGEFSKVGAILLTHLRLCADNNFRYKRISNKIKKEYTEKGLPIPQWERRISILRDDLREFTNKKNIYMPAFTPKFFLYTKSDGELEEGANSSLKSFLKRHVKKEFESTEIKPTTEAESTPTESTTETVEPTKDVKPTELIENDVIHEFFRFFVLPRTLLHTSKLFYNSYAKPFLIAKPQDIKALLPSHFPLKSLYDNNYKRDGIDFEKSHGAIKVTFSNAYLDYTKGTMQKRQRLELPVQLFLHALHRDRMGHTVTALKFLLLTVFSLHTSRSKIVCKPSTIISLCDITSKRGLPYQVTLLNKYFSYLHSVGLIPQLYQLTRDDLLLDKPLDIALTKLKTWTFRVRTESGETTESVEASEPTTEPTS